jgi:hypothetical protein
MVNCLCEEEGSGDGTEDDADGVDGKHRAGVASCLGGRWRWGAAIWTSSPDGAVWARTSSIGIDDSLVWCTGNSGGGIRSKLPEPCDGSVGVVCRCVDDTNHSPLAMWPSCAVVPDWAGLVDLDGECWHEVIGQLDWHESREEARRGSVSSWDWGAWVCKGRLCDGVVLGVEVELNKFTNFNPQIIGEEPQRSIAVTDLDNVDLDFSGLRNGSDLCRDEAGESSCGSEDGGFAEQHIEYYF